MHAMGLMQSVLSSSWAHSTSCDHICACIIQRSDPIVFLPLLFLSSVLVCIHVSSITVLIMTEYSNWAGEDKDSAYGQQITHFVRALMSNLEQPRVCIPTH